MQLIRNGQPCLENKYDKNQLCPQETLVKKEFYEFLNLQEIENISRALKSRTDLSVD